MKALNKPNFINKLENKIIDLSNNFYNLALMITALGSVPVLVSYLIFLSILGYLNQNWLFLKVALSSLIIMITNSLLKLVFAKTRPISKYSQNLKTYSFPSGHSTGSSISYLNLAFIVSQYCPDLSFLFYSVAITLFLAIGLSRVCLKAHYLIDVIAGLSFGTIGFFISMLLY